MSRLLSFKIQGNKKISESLKTVISSFNYKCLWLSFFERNPLFYYSIFFLFGLALNLTKHPLILFLAAFLLALSYYFYRREMPFKIASAGLFLCIGISFARFYVTMPDDEVSGTAYFRPISQKSGTQERILISGTLLQFYNKQGANLAKNIPCFLSIRKVDHKPLPRTDMDWIIKGTLKRKNSSWELTPESYQFWKEAKPFFSLNSLRQRLKDTAGHFIKKHIPDEKSAHFITGMVTGSFSDQELSLSFSRFGLQHILAISGFHFSLLASIAAFFLAPLLRGKFLSLSLILSLTLYLLFLGASPSIIRAWTMISLSLFACLIERRISPFNSLGAALFLTLIYDPCSLFHVGFILSFAITFSILAFTKPMDALIKMFLPERPFEVISKMDSLDKGGFLILSKLKSIFALTLAVNVLALPLLLACFGSFPVFSLLFNLFFPLFAGGVIFLFAVSSTVLPFFYPLGELLFQLTSLLTSALLHLSLDSPSSWNLQIMFTLEKETALFLCFLLFLLGIFASEHCRKKEESIFF